MDRRANRPARVHRRPHLPYGNVRLNAHQKGPVTNPAQMLTGQVSVVGPNAPPINNPNAVLGFIGNGMEFTTGAAPAFKQCAPQNAALAQNSNQNGTPQFQVTFTEGFAGAFKPRTIAPYVNANTSPAPAPQTDPNAFWNSESGYFDPASRRFPAVAILGRRDSPIKARACSPGSPACPSS